MKKNNKIKNLIVSMLLIGSIISPANTYAQFLKALGNLFNSLAEGAVSAVCQQSCVKAGYSQEEATKMTSDALEYLGADIQNINRGISYVNADKYQKQNLAKDLVFDLAAQSDPKNQQLIEYFRQTTDAQLTYLSERTRATSDEERKAAFDNRSRTYADITFNTYQYVKDKRAELLAEKMKIKRQLEAKGYDSDMAREIAGTILAIQKSNLPENEKEKLLRSYGFAESPEEIRAFVNEIMNENPNYEAQNEQARLEAEKREAERIEAERLERERIEAERRAAEEKRIALDKITHISPCKYKFDEIELSDLQKQELDEVANILNKYNDISVLLIGHTCNIGYKNINYKKGLQRANAAKDYLLKKGIEENRIQTDSKGELEPIYSNTTFDGRSKNRRVEISIVK